ncbi:DUF6541 family protein [Halomontanus rarus]|uniref:DUF6541 family protein n=1 Tax=Halomontanus rarus TaxID=3034020 RepID=UPI0023E8A0C2|nr:DUF6541 family protein [Halovivax sp. TS33]
MTGAISPDDFYPLLQILTTELSFILNIDPHVLMKILPPVFSLIYIFGVFCFVRWIFDDRRVLLLVLSVITLPILQFEHLFFRPYNAGYFLLPLVLFLYFRLLFGWKHPSAGHVAFLLATLPVVFYHPLIALILIGILLLWRVTAIFVRLKQRDRQSHFVSRGRSILVIELIIVLTFSWYTMYRVVVLSGASIFIGRGSSEYEQISEVAERTSPSILDLLQRGFAAYGLEMIIIAVTSVMVVYLGYNSYKRNNSIKGFIFFLCAIFMASTFLSFLSIFIDIVFEPERFLMYAIFSGVIVTSVGFSTLLQNSSKVMFRTIWSTFCSYLFILAVMSTILIYPSPITDTANYQVTEHETEGMNWVLNNHNPKIDIQEHGIEQNRFADLLGDTESDFFAPSENRYPPDHFGYDNTSTVGAGYEEDTYIVITKLGRLENPVLYPDYPEFWRHTPADFEQLEVDNTANAIYSNGEFDMYLINSRNEDL